jgi:type II secretory pathway component GspD/PulD (secretin)
MCIPECEPFFGGFRGKCRDRMKDFSLAPLIQLRISFLILVATCLLPTREAAAQEPVPSQEVATPVIAPGSPDGVTVTVTQGSPGAESVPSNAPPDPNEMPPAGPAGPEGAPKAVGTESIKRGDVPGMEPGDKSELAVRADSEGYLAFSFRNQPWPGLIEWLAEVSGQPIDWQELPADTVNLASTGKHSLNETRDLFNRYLLARGYVILDLPGGLSVVKIANLNSALVPRLTSSQLDSELPHSFVRCSLDCGWLLAKQMAEELKPMLSNNGKMVSFEVTNRLEVMDACVNVRQIYEFLQNELSGDSQMELAREFELRHIPADEAKKMLSVFLGIEESAPPAMVSPEQMQQMQQMQMQMQQQMQQAGTPMPQEGNKKKVAIVVNSRRNSLLVNAPPDRMAIVDQFVRKIDVPDYSLQSFADVKTRIQVFRLSSLDPAKLVEMARDLNVLEPSTRLRVDDKNNALIVSGSAADRFVIQQLIERLDGSARKFEVLQLRRLEAQEVAESIMFLMGAEEEEEQPNNSRFFYSFFGGMDEDKDKKKDRFRVAANSRFRQVLLWANQYEMEEVRNLLVKLGELPPEGGDSRRMRVVEGSATPETLQYLLELKQRFERLRGNELLLPQPDQFSDPISDDPVTPSEAVDESPPISGSEDAIGEFEQKNDAALAPQYQLTQLRTEITDDEQANPSPVRIELDPEGNLILLSDDTEALDLLESIMLDFAPPKRPYAIFRVRYASATWMMLNLTDYFKDSKDEKKEDDSFMRWYFDLPAEKDNSPTGLGKAKPLKFVADNDTGSIVVSGASASELKTIGELIKLWDVPEPVNKRQARFTRLMTIRYSRAERIAETIKDAYRDLLSSNDRTFSQGGPGQGSQDGGASGVSTDRSQPRDRNGGGAGLIDSGGKSSGEVNFNFKGKLSIGVDSVGNTMLISAEGEDLLDLVCDMIEQLDKGAKDQGLVQVRSVATTVNAQTLEKALQAFTQGASKTVAGQGMVQANDQPVVNPSGQVQEKPTQETP